MLHVSCCTFLLLLVIVVDRSGNLRFRVCCAFGCSLFSSKMISYIESFRGGGTEGGTFCFISVLLQNLSWLFSQPAPMHHTKECSNSSADSPGARVLVFAAFEWLSSCEFRASIVRTPFCAILWRSPIPRGPKDWKNSIPIDRMKFSIHTLENFNPGLKFSISIESFNLAWKFQSRPW